MHGLMYIKKRSKKCRSAKILCLGAALACLTLLRPEQEDNTKQDRHCNYGESNTVAHYRHVYVYNTSVTLTT